MAVHSTDAQHGGGKWGSDWLIEPGSRTGTYRIKSCGNSEGGQPPGWELSAWRFEASNDIRNGGSSWVTVYGHPDPKVVANWGSDWELQKLGN